MTRFYVTPRPGLTPRDPDTLEILGPDGAYKSHKRTWKRISKTKGKYPDVVISEKPLTNAEFKKAFGVDRPAPVPTEPAPAEKSASKKEA